MIRPFLSTSKRVRNTHDTERVVGEAEDSSKKDLYRESPSTRKRTHGELYTHENSPDTDRQVSRVPTEPVRDRRPGSAASPAESRIRDLNSRIDGLLAKAKVTEQKSRRLSGGI